MYMSTEKTRSKNKLIFYYLKPILYLLIKAAYRIKLYYIIDVFS